MTICSSRSATTSDRKNSHKNSTTTSARFVRITPDGAAPADNPFVGNQGALPEIWAYGLRNAQGLAFNPADGKLWEQEHGPMGGDEINIIEKLKTTAGRVRELWSQTTTVRRSAAANATMEGVTDPIWHWTPSMHRLEWPFTAATSFPVGRGSLLNGALKFELLSRLELKRQQDSERRAPSAEYARAHSRCAART